MKKNIWRFVLPAAVLFLAISIMAPAKASAQTFQTNLCYTFTRNLGIGTTLTAAEASGLQMVLKNEGLWNINYSLTTYDETVASAIVGFQEKYRKDILTANGLTHGTGYLGNSTRAKANSLYSCGTPLQTTPIYSNTYIQGSAYVQSNAAVCPAGYTCQAIVTTQPICPAGYICSPTTVPLPVATTSSCPAGYSCCPAGYSCPQTTTVTTVNPSQVCPSGYNCYASITSISPSSGPYGQIGFVGSGFLPGTTVRWTLQGGSNCPSGYTCSTNYTTTIPNYIATDGTIMTAYPPSGTTGLYSVKAFNGNSESNAVTFNLTNCPAGYTCN